jgi:ribonuclease Y
MKGRIIGRKGATSAPSSRPRGQPDHRRHPGGGLLSCFDPYAARWVANRSRRWCSTGASIQPDRGDAHPLRAEVEQLCLRTGEDALVEWASPRCTRDLVTHTRPTPLPDVVRQNVLKHLVESAFLPE